MVAIFSVQKTTLQDFPDKIAAIVFLAGCNFRCVYCHNPAAINGKPNVSEKEFFAFLESRTGKLQGIVVSGGEPTIYPDLPEFISKIKQMGFLAKLDTNGSNPEMLEKLFSRRLLDYVAMDVKAPFAKYPAISAVRGMTAKLKKSIRLVMRSKVDYEFKTTVHPSLSRTDLLAVGKYIKGAKRFFLQHYVDEVTLNPQKHLAVYDDSALQKIALELKPFVGEIHVR
ncbi:MAG: anaerobic ribonucleoside-triphosphate reductase activating protein [Candidatus Micrarchaeota archaeon]